MPNLHGRKELFPEIDYTLIGEVLTPISPEAQETIDRLLQVPVFPFMLHFCEQSDDGSVKFTDPTVTHFVGSTLNQHAPLIGG